MTENKKDGTNPYINRDTANLVRALEGFIQSRADLDDPAVSISFEAFKRICQEPPVIVDYVRRKLDAVQLDAGLNPEQLELMMLATVARSSSTWGTIQAEAALLGLVGEHEAAAIINANAMNETGDKNHRPHSLLLFDSFAALSSGLDIKPLTPASYHLLRQIHRLGLAQGYSAQQVEDALQNDSIHIPHTPQDMETALHYSTISTPDIIDYHSKIMQTVLGLDDRGIGTASRNPYDPRWRALRALELALREASSVDEHDTGKLSYIGSWGLVVDAMLGHVPYDQRNQALAWTRAHNDEATGQSVGWQGKAEVGHAADAEKVVSAVLETLSPDIVVQTLEGVTALGLARLDYWNRVVDVLKAKEEKAPKIPISRTTDIPYIEPRQEKPHHPPSQWKQRLFEGAISAGILLGLGAGGRMIYDGNKAGWIASNDITTVVRLNAGQQGGGLADQSGFYPNSVLTLKLPGELYRLFKESPDAFTNPEAVALAAHGMSLRKKHGILEPDQVVCTYIEDLSIGSKPRVIEVTVENFSKEIKRLLESLSRPHGKVDVASNAKAVDRLLNK